MTTPEMVKRGARAMFERDFGRLVLIVVAPFILVPVAIAVLGVSGAMWFAVGYFGAALVEFAYSRFRRAP